jgi:hypothetical protein
MNRMQTKRFFTKKPMLSRSIRLSVNDLELWRAAASAEGISQQQGYGSDFDESTNFVASFAQWICIVRKTFKAKHSCKQVLMNTEFRYDGPLRKIGFQYSGPEWVFLAIVFLLTIFLLWIWS